MEMSRSPSIAFCGRSLSKLRCRGRATRGSDIHQAHLKQVQRQHQNFLVLQLIARELGSCTYLQQIPFTARFRDQKKPGVGNDRYSGPRLAPKSIGSSSWCSTLSRGYLGYLGREVGHPIRPSVTRGFFMVSRKSTVSLAFRLFCRHDRKEKCLEEDIIRRRSSAL